MARRDTGKQEPNEDSGLTRREMLRRGAIVGGTLLWVTPAIQSLTPNAYAVQQVGSFKACCECGNNPHKPRTCTVDAISFTECNERCGGGSRANYFVGRYACVDGNCIPVERGGEGRQSAGARPAQARPAA